MSAWTWFSIGCGLFFAWAFGSAMWIVWKLDNDQDDGGDF